MHQWPWYPGTGAAEDRGPLDSVWNVPMAAQLAPGDSISFVATTLREAMAALIAQEQVLMAFESGERG